MTTLLAPKDERVGKRYGDCHTKGNDRAKCQEERLRVDRLDVVPSHVCAAEEDKDSKDCQPDDLHDDHRLQGVVDEVTIKQFHFSRVSSNVRLMMVRSCSMILSLSDTE